MLKVLKSGFYSSVQDKGRFGYRAYGVPRSGAMDAYSADFANALLGNDASAAVIEMTMVGGKFQFLESTFIVISGADMSPAINGNAVKQNTIIPINANTVVDFGNALLGFRTYVAIKGGFRSELVLESRSQYNEITTSAKLCKGDVIKYMPFARSYNAANAVVKYNKTIWTLNIIEVYQGPEFNWLSDVQKNQLFTTEFKVSKLNSRMAYQLTPLLKNDLKPIITSPVLPGTVQLTPSGTLIVLMRDCQTTGGYPRILQLTENAINSLGQKTIENSINLRLIE
ncbi:biotin-dependent carboxyltransferase family protein [uncultured Winogradskyella sp.]|uniref:5-oxoprolinase subunit C family protein n=1 Tax=uncultured Winogradskyella sp. TaxID=395353 RepID=UPI0026041E9C|nr:biotin-dependent carboxyltransferase family protein [uncultured Winogradskyella sp.]